VCLPKLVWLPRQTCGWCCLNRTLCSESDYSINLHSKVVNDKHQISRTSADPSAPLETSWVISRLWASRFHR
jgi:hypothetical protein